MLLQVPTYRYKSFPSHAPTQLVKITIFFFFLLKYALITGLYKHIRLGDINTFLYHGVKRQSAIEQLHSFDVVLTIYNTLRLN